MLIQLSIKNYKSFRDKTILSMIASNYDKNSHENSHVFHDNMFGLRILKSAFVYGGNASGKTKLFDALHTMQWLVLNSSKEIEKGELIQKVDPFRLDSKAHGLATEFEVIFLHNGTQYRYGFELTKIKVISEWLYLKENKKEIEVFFRDDKDFAYTISRFKKGLLIKNENILRDNVLLLSYAVQQLNVQGDLLEVFNWFQDYLKFANGLSNVVIEGYTQSLICESTEKKMKILKMLSDGDIGIVDLSIEELSFEEQLSKVPPVLRDHLRSSMKENREPDSKFLGDTFTKHTVFNNDEIENGSVDFSMEDDESSGTRKFFALCGPIIDAIESGKTLFIDEIEAKLHPNLVKKIVDIFNSHELNPNNAQLITNTHNTNLLDKNILRRDQIWFVEKNKLGASLLYSLSDFPVQKTENFEDNYIRGKYGAVPFVGNFNFNDN